MFNLLKSLCNINGGPSKEDNVREYIKKEISDFCDIVEEDKLKNLIVFKKGKKTPKNKICLFAHMDEVAFLINYIEDNGLLKFSSVGGISPNVVVGKRLVSENGTTCIVGSEPIHLVNKTNKKTQSLDELFLDIGANNKDDAEKYVNLYDFCYFENEYEEIGENLICSKALDDRVGCAIMIDIIKNELEYDCYFIFTTREEVGCIGAKTTCFDLKPDIAIVLECTTACDNLEVSKREKVCSLGDGAVISYIDKGAIYDKKLYDLAVKTANKYNIKWQTKTMVYGANDASQILQSAGGCRVIAFSAPGRNFHSPVSIINKDDVISIKNLTINFIKEINN